METIERTRSVIDQSGELETLHTLKDFPVFMGCVDHPRDEDLVADQTWDICRHTGVIQLKHLIPLEVLYQEQHCSVVGDLWLQHHKAFAAFVNVAAPQTVLELGGAHGTLSKLYAELQPTSSWTILEPNPAPAADVKARYIAGFFDSTFQADQNYDAVVHSHVFEHMYEPDEFVRALANFRNGGVRHLFAVPNIKSWFGRKYTNALNFEHTVFITEEYIDYLLGKHGLRVERKQHYGDEHSIFYDVVRRSNQSYQDQPPGLYASHKSMFLDYIRYHEELIDSINQQMQAEGGDIFLFGAHVFSQYLLAFGLDTSRIVCILDNNPLKHNYRLYGTDMMVRSPEVLRGLQNPRVILKAGSHTEEIRRGILGNINSSTRFLE
jgi:hypothetical protein